MSVCIGCPYRGGKEIHEIYVPTRTDTPGHRGVVPVWGFTTNNLLTNEWSSLKCPQVYCHRTDQPSPPVVDTGDSGGVNVLRRDPESLTCIPSKNKRTVISNRKNFFVGYFVIFESREESPCV